MISSHLAQGTPRRTVGLAPAALGLGVATVVVSDNVSSLAAPPSAPLPPLAGQTADLQQQHVRDVRAVSPKVVQIQTRVGLESGTSSTATKTWSPTRTSCAERAALSSRWPKAAAIGPCSSAPTPKARSTPRVVDEVFELYVHSRQACADVGVDDERWRLGRPEDRPPAFVAYGPALEREETAAGAYVASWSPHHG